MAKYKNSLFVFRRDLRIADNNGLRRCLDESEKVSYVFFVDPRQIEPNPWRSESAIYFMFESLRELHQSLVDAGASLFVVKFDLAADFISKGGFDALFACADYTPFAAKRDKELAAISPVFITTHDILLIGHPRGVKDDANAAAIPIRNNPNFKPYLKYSSFYKKYADNKLHSSAKADNKLHSSANFKVALPDSSYVASIGKKRGVVAKSTESIIGLFLEQFASAKSSVVRGGRSAALARIKELDLKTYGAHRDELCYETSRLSAHNKFGTISVREAYAAFKARGDTALIAQLFWRDFYYIICACDSHALASSHDPRYDFVAWARITEPAIRKRFVQWATGTTGVPIVDACMRELNATHYMHNRGRLITSGYLVKNLGINWRVGEQYFASQLVDYDPTQNNYGWQWSAGSGAFAQPYFRVLSPSRQAARFDPDNKYVKMWIPELQQASAKEIADAYTNAVIIADISRYKAGVAAGKKYDYAADIAAAAEIIKELKTAK